MDYMTLKEASEKYTAASSHSVLLRPARDPGT